MKCKKCAAENSEEAVFCKRCGASLLPDHVCKSCGTVNETDADFCVKCGGQLEHAAGQSTPEDSAAESATVEAAAPVQRAVSKPSPVLKARKPRKPMKKKTKLLLTAGLAAILLIVVVPTLIAKQSFEASLAIHEDGPMFENGLASVSDQERIINTDGETVFTVGDFFQNSGSYYYWCSPVYANDVVRVIRLSQGGNSGASALVGMDGQMRTDFRYEGIYSGNGHLLLVRTKDGDGYINAMGEEVIPPIYSIFSPGITDENEIFLYDNKNEKSVFLMKKAI